MESPLLSLACLDIRITESDTEYLFNRKPISILKKKNNDHFYISPLNACARAALYYENYRIYEQIENIVSKNN